METRSQTINVTTFCVKCLSLQQLGNGRGFIAHLCIFNAVFILTTNTTFITIRLLSIVLQTAMGFQSWSQTLMGTRILTYVVFAFIYLTDPTRCDYSYRSEGSRGDSRHGLGFLNLGRKNFLTDRTEKYRNNLVLTRIRNADKLNATCIGKSLLFPLVYCSFRTKVMYHIFLFALCIVAYTVTDSWPTLAIHQSDRVSYT